MALGHFLPWLEIVTAMALLLGRLYLGALLSVSGLGVVFAVAVGSAWWRGLDISCGCFGSLVSGRVSAVHTLSALLFIGIGSALLAYNGFLASKRIRPGSCQEED